MCLRCQITVFSLFPQTDVTRCQRPRYLPGSVGGRQLPYLISCSPHSQHVVGVHGRHAVSNQLVAVGSGGRDDVLPSRHLFQLKPEGA